MIKEPTVFVLGAGASCHYDFPLGATLTKRICETLDCLGRDENERNKFENISSIKLSDISDMSRYIRGCGGLTIDEWLGINTKYKEIGRVLIAKEIIKYEDINKILEGNKNNWYSDLWSQYLRPDCHKPSDIEKNNVTFITFNYDRSLEATLMEYIDKTYLSSDINEKVSAVKSIKIIHVHGQLGVLPWQSASDNDARYSRRYVVSHEWEDAVAAAEGIKIINEAIDDSREFIQARNAIQEAQRIYFMGFGYHTDNLRRLSPDCFHPEFNHAYGSGIKLPKRDVAFLANANNKFGKVISIESRVDSLVEYLEQIVLKK